MGIVYEARQTGLNRRVAMKMVLAGELAQPRAPGPLPREAEAAARLHHPNIVQIYDLGEHAGLPFLSLEYVAGGTLADLLARGPLLPRDAAQTILTLARAIELRISAESSTAILSQPISCSRATSTRTRAAARLRIGITGPRVVKVADFGLAKVLREDHQTQTTSGALLGTPSYMRRKSCRGDA